MNTASGAGSPASASGAAPVTTRSEGTPSRSALRAMRSARSGSRSTVIARQDGWVRSHSTAIEPEPPPTSHSSSPGAGARTPSVAARTWRLVSCPSCSYAVSGSPGTAPRRGVSGAARQSTATMLSGSPGGCAQVAAVPSRQSSSVPPSCSSTRIRLGPKPRSRSRAATAAGVAASALSTSSRRPWCSAAASRARGRPTTVTVSVSSSGQPSRAQAYDTEDGCGTTCSAPAPSSSVRARPIP